MFEVLKNRSVMLKLSRFNKITLSSAEARSVQALHARWSSVKGATSEGKRASARSRLLLLLPLNCISSKPLRKRPNLPCMPRQFFKMAESCLQEDARSAYALIKSKQTERIIQSAVASDKIVCPVCLKADAKKPTFFLPGTGLQ